MVIKTYWIIHLKLVNFIACKLHLNKNDFKKEKQTKRDTYTIEKETQDDLSNLH